ncbi:hypothetical protein LR48_Vigan01g057300 [Vigna angularis]|uniref:RING-type domain-containing protein n=1 Tax=Phaseolus angularis TaxID=3914 RepID=A0A0L9TKA3_PHAAN|nr:hypothetical protein LR48_Vigan01g057300 [Vigna angularis]
MPSSILQRMHRKIHAPWVGPHTATYAIYLIDLIGLVNILAPCCTVLTNSNWFYYSINECPICRVHVPSRRSLREDPNFDKLIAALVPDIDKYEEQKMEAMSVENAPSSSVENAPCERDTSPRKKKARAIAVAFERMRKCEGKDRRDGRKLRNAGEIQVSNENEVLNDNNAGKELCYGVPRKDGEGQTQIPQESATIHVDREISSSANFHQTNTLLNDQDKGSG